MSNNEYVVFVASHALLISYGILLIKKHTKRLFDKEDK